MQPTLKSSLFFIKQVKPSLLCTYPHSVVAVFKDGCYPISGYRFFIFIGMRIINKTVCFPVKFTQAAIYAPHPDIILAILAKRAYFVADNTIGIVLLMRVM